MQRLHCNLDWTAFAFTIISIVCISIVKVRSSFTVHVKIAYSHLKRSPDDRIPRHSNDCTNIITNRTKFCGSHIFFPVVVRLKKICGNISIAYRFLHRNVALTVCTVATHQMLLLIDAFRCFFFFLHYFCCTLHRQQMSSDTLYRLQCLCTL